MKKTSLFTLLLIPALLAGCGKNGKEPKGAFAVPLVDVENLQINLPQMPTLDTTSAVKNDGTYDIIDLYEISDMHAMIDSDSSKGYFGFDGISKFIKDKRNENKGTILLSSGDMWQGGAESNLTQGKIVAEAMRYVGFDCMALGNHEFDWGKDVLVRNSNYFKNDMPLLAGNLQYKADSTRPEFVGGSKVVERGGYKVGVIGTIGQIEYSISKTVFSDFKLASSYTFAQEEAQHLKNDLNCDVIVWLSHENTEQLSSVPQYVDAFFGGHEHKDYNLTKTNGSSVPAPALATRNYGQDIAHIELKINPSTKAVESASGDIINAASSYMVSDPNIASLFSQYRVETDKVKQYELNNVSGKFRASSELANLSTKAMFETYKDENTLCAFQNGNGGVRTDLNEGKVNYGHIYTAFPFDNEMVRFEISGADVANFFDLSEVRSLNVYCPIRKLSQIDQSKTYNIITTDFVCTNYLNYSEDKFSRYAGSVIRDCVAKYIYDTNGLNAENFKSINEYSRPR